MSKTTPLIKQTVRLFLSFGLLSGFGLFGLGVCYAAEREKPNDSAIATSPATLLFEENFEQGIQRWEVFDPKTWSLNTTRDSTTFEIIARESEYKPTVRSPLHVAMLKGIELGSFAMTIKVRSTLDTGNHRDCCLFFGFQDREHFYYVHLGAKPDPASGQIMVVNGLPRTPITKNERPTPWGNDWHTIRLERDLEAGTIKVYFDDFSKPHLEVADTTFGKGRIGIGSFDDRDEFDDLEIHLLN